MMLSRLYNYNIIHCLGVCHCAYLYTSYFRAYNNNNNSIIVVVSVPIYRIHRYYNYL